MQTRQITCNPIIRLIEEYECKKRINGEPYRMNGAELLKIIKTNDFDMILKRLKENEDIQKKFYDLESKFLSILNFKDFFEILLTEIGNTFHIPYVWLSVIENSPLADLINRISDSEIISKHTNFIKKDDFDKAVKGSTKPVLINKYLSPFSIFFPKDGNFPLRSMAIAPVYIDGKIVGSLNQGDYASTRFDPDMDTSLLEQLMMKISLCLSNVAAHERLTYFAYRDPLTGLLNRRSFETALHKEFSRSRRHNTDMAVVFIDLDRFKQINDRYGHECGDLALKYVSQTLESISRKEDIVARLAGDEFVLILPETQAETSECLMNRIQEHLDQNPLHHKGAKLPLSLSYGIASTEETEIARPDALLKKADDRLYVSKGKKVNDMPVSHPRFLQAKAS